MATDPPSAADAADPPLPDGVCTTTEAARLLGVSGTTVQAMVERGELQAWKTLGGHRRIARASIDALRTARGVPAPVPPPAMLVIEADVALRRACTGWIAGWEPPLRVAAAADGLEALLLAGRRRPDLLLVGLPMAGVGLEAFLRTLRQHGGGLPALLVATAPDDASLRVPAGAMMLARPLTEEALRRGVEECLRVRADPA